MSWPEHDSSDSEPLPLKRLPPTMNVTLLTQRRGRGRGLLQSTLKMMNLVIFRTMQLHFRKHRKETAVDASSAAIRLRVCCLVMHVSINLTSLRGKAFTVTCGQDPQVKAIQEMTQSVCTS